MNRLSNVLLEAAERATTEQLPTGSFRAGTNGGYGDCDTPLRNTSHWAFSFARAFMMTNDPKFSSSLERAICYIEKCIRTCRGGLVMRISRGKDHTNGILGPAHILESLIEAATALQSDAIRTLAEEYYCRHAFNASRGLWNSTDPNGKVLPPDGTFNHQLYFAAVACQLQGEQAKIDVANFLQCLERNFGVNKDGRIKHFASFPSRTLKQSLKGLINAVYDKKGAESFAKKEDHYHLYNMYAFAVLSLHTGSDFPAIQKRLAKAIEYARSVRFAEFRHALETATSPLVSGSETIACDNAVYQKVFLSENIDYLEDGLVAFLNKTLAPDGSALLFSPDPETQKARVYRYYRCL
jgi:hypothetical protein